MTTGMRRLIAGLALLGLVALWLLPNADAWFRFVLAMLGTVQ